MDLLGPRRVTDPQCGRTSYRAASRSHPRCGDEERGGVILPSLFATILVLLGATIAGEGAAQYYNPPSPISPKTSDECDALSAAWQQRIEQLRNELEECEKQEHDKWDACLTRMGRSNECDLTYACPETWCKGRCASSTIDGSYLWRGCKAQGDAWGCAISDREATVSNCRADVKAYQKRDEQAKQTTLREETERTPQAEDSKDANRTTTEEHPDTKEAVTAKSEFQKELDDYERWTDLLQKQTARNEQKAARHDAKADKAATEVESKAGAVAADNAGISVKLAQLRENVKALVGEGDKKPGMGFDLGESAAAKRLDSLLDLEEHLVPMVAAIPFGMLRNVIQADVRLLGKLETAIGDFGGMSQRSADGDLLVEYAHDAFSPKGFARAVEHAVLTGAISSMASEDRRTYGRLETIADGADWWIDLREKSAEGNSQPQGPGPLGGVVVLPFREEDTERRRADLRNWAFFFAVRAAFSGNAAGNAR